MAMQTQEDTPATRQSDYEQVEPDTAARSRCCCCRTFARRLFELLEFHTFNAALGLGGGVLVWVLVPLSLVLVPLCGLGLVAFRSMMRVLVRLARLDVKLASQQCPYDLKMHAFLEDQVNFQTTSCSHLTSPIPATHLRLLFYFAIPKFLVGALSGAAAAWTVEQPLLALISGGYNDVLGITTLEANPILYISVLLGCSLVGVICTILLPKLSIPLTLWACCEFDGGDGIEVICYDTSAGPSYHREAHQ